MDVDDSPSGVGPRRVREKLNDAVRSLALDPRRLPERLDPAAGHLTELVASDFDDDGNRQEFEELIGLLTREPAVGEEGTISATVRIMSVDEALEIAERIVNLAARYS